VIIDALKVLALILVWSVAAVAAVLAVKLLVTGVVRVWRSRSSLVTRGISCPAPSRTLRMTTSPAVPHPTARMVVRRSNSTDTAQAARISAHLTATRDDREPNGDDVTSSVAALQMANCQPIWSHIRPASPTCHGGWQRADAGGWEGSSQVSLRSSRGEGIGSNGIDGGPAYGRIVNSTPVLSRPVVVEKRNSISSSASNHIGEHWFTILVARCRGVQVGEHNRQINVYGWRIERPRVDFSKVFDRPAVRDALCALSQDPRNASLRQEAERVMCAGTWSLLGSSVIDLGKTERTGSPSELSRQLSLIDGSVIIEDCRGVLVADCSTQRNNFQYICRGSKIDASELLSANPRIARLLVDSVTKPTTPAGLPYDLNRELAQTLRNTDVIRNLEQHSVRVPHNDRPHRVVDSDGVSIGCGSVNDRTDVNFDLSNTPSSIRRTTHDVARSMLEQNQVTSPQSISRPPSPADGPPSPAAIGF
jgi:hypothetical protein